jgi:anti-anti-sigma regulatory factor
MLDVRRNGTLFEVTGSLDGDGARRLLAAISRCDGDVRIDGSGLVRIDGAGVTALVLAARDCRATGRAFELLTVAPDATAGLRAGRQLPHILATTPLAPVQLAAEPESEMEMRGVTTDVVDDRARRRWFRLHRDHRNRDVHG